MAVQSLGASFFEGKLALSWDVMTETKSLLVNVAKDAQLMDVLACRQTHNRRKGGTVDVPARANRRRDSASGIRKHKLSTGPAKRVSDEIKEKLEIRDIHQAAIALHPAHVIRCGGGKLGVANSRLLMSRVR